MGGRCRTIRPMNSAEKLQHGHDADPDFLFRTPLLHQFPGRPGTGVRESFEKSFVGQHQRAYRNRDGQDNLAMHHALEKHLAGRFKPVVHGHFETTQAKPALAGEPDLGGRAAIAADIFVVALSEIAAVEHSFHVVVPMFGYLPVIGRAKTGTKLIPTKSGG